MGSVEGVFDEITKRLWTRRYVVRNRRRLELALRLMLLDKEGISDELRYREAIRSALLRAQGRPTASRRSLDDGWRLLDPRGRSCGHHEDGDKAGQNARHARASYGRKKKAGVSRTKPRSARRLRAACAP